MTPFDLVPSAPEWSVDWEAICNLFPVLNDLKGTPHDPIHHAEGCPWVHTRLVCEEMARDPKFRHLPEKERNVAFLTAILHDVAKAVTADVDPEGRVSHPGHSRVGAIMARVVLWRCDVEPMIRERVCAAIGLHQVPFWLLERDWSGIRRVTIGSSRTCGNEVLAVQAAADARGRIAPDRARMIEAVELFRLAADEAECLSGPFPVADGPTLLAYMNSPDSVDPAYPMPRPSFRPVATVMSGLPGSGKSTWLDRNLASVPVISLDRIRDELGIPPEKPQGKVIAAAKEEAKRFLRAGTEFAWDGTNLSRDIRDAVLGLCRDYGFATRLVVAEATPQEIKARFAARGRAVPAAAFERLLRRWDHPAPWEADEVVGPGFRVISSRTMMPSP